MDRPEQYRVRYSVVVPVYETDRSVVELVERLRRVFEETLKASYEIILVDDGSRSPMAWPTLRRLAEEVPQVLAIRLTRNYGKPGAVLCGLSHAGGRWIVTIDDDLQQRPEDIPKLVEHQDHDVVVANFTKRNHATITVLTSRIKSYFDRIILGVPCKLSPLKLFKAEIAKGMVQVRTSRPFIPALMTHVTRDFVPVVVEHAPSHHGKSRYTLRQRLKQFSDLLIGNSSLLLRCVGLFGGGAALVGLAFALGVVIRKLSGDPLLPGWASLVIINLIFGGLILIVLAIIGEYLIRILEGSTAKPAFIVREVVRHDSASCVSIAEVEAAEAE